MKAAISMRTLYSGLLLTLILLLAACQPIAPMPAVEEATATPTALPEETPEPTPEPAVDAAEAGAVNAPVTLSIPDLDLEIPVEPMGWEPTTQAGQRTTRWVVPEEAVGWAVTSAGAGEAGNTVIAGHQARGAALFAPIALGDVAVEQTIDLATESGDVFTYRVVEVSDPIPVIGATDDERAQSAAYMAPTTDGRLTLITGWPADTTTHRVFVVAELVGAAE
ncbi:MAG: sortase [Caldilinea sp.]|nr:sortase [Caldilinea sp.]